MSQIADSPAQTFPPFYFTRRLNVASTGQALLIDGTLFSPGAALIQSIDLVDFSLVNGDNAHVFVNELSLGNPDAVFFRGFTYTSSQGYFAWRGEMVLFPGNGIFLQVFQGNWWITVNGVAIPSYATNPAL